MTGKKIHIAREKGSGPLVPICGDTRVNKERITNNWAYAQDIILEDLQQETERLCIKCVDAADL